MLITFVDNRQANDLILQFETALLLRNRPDLIGIIVYIDLIIKLKFLDIKNQEELANELGLSENTYKKRRDELVALGVIDVTKAGKLIVVTLNNVKRIAKFELPKDSKIRKEYVDSFKSKIVAENNEYKKLQEDQQAQLVIDAKIAEKAKIIAKKKEQAILKEEQRFPGEDYRSVLDAFCKYKGIGLMGPEVNRAKHAIKQMFLAKRSVKEIVDCIKFFASYQNDEEFKWMKQWTLETVMKKMPEFVAGKLKPHRMEEDYPELPSVKKP